jgi:uncharacterized protein YndB with AHSA1/START domain
METANASPQPIVQTHHLPAPPEVVFEWLTNPEYLDHWGGPDVKFAPVVGEQYSLFGDWVTGNVRAVQAPHLLEYTWKVAEWEEGAPESVVRYELTPAPKGGTAILLTHTGFPSATERDSHASGWYEHVFDPLRELLAQQ